MATSDLVVYRMAIVSTEGLYPGVRIALPKRFSRLQICRRELEDRTGVGRLGVALCAASLTYSTSTTLSSSSGPLILLPS